MEAPAQRDVTTGSRPSRFPGLCELLLAVYFVSCLTPVYDSDVWLHLASGRAMWESGRVLTADIFSHTAAGAAWVYHEWLAAVLSYGVWLAAGVNGLVVGKALIMTAAMGFVLAAMALGGQARGPAAALTLLAAMVASRNVALERPHLVTMLFLAAWVYWLRRQRATGRPLPWGMVAMSAFWANTHGGFVLGLLAFGPFLVEDLVILWRRDPGHPQFDAAERLQRSVVMLGLCVAAVLVNPYGVETLLYPLQYANPSPFMRQIEEWASPDFQKQIVLEAVLLGLAGALMLSRRRVGLADGILAVASCHLILTGVRNSFLVGPFLAPAAAEHVADVLDREGAAGRLAGRIGAWDRGFRGTWLAAALLVGSVWTLASAPRIAAGRFPEKAVAWLAAERPAGRLFNDYDFGGYLMFHLPEVPVFVDGRVDVYSKHAAFGDFLKIWRLAPDWRQLLERYGVGVVLIDRRQPLAALLGVASGWREAYRDDRAVVFVRR